MTHGEAVRLAGERLSAAGVESPRVDARILMDHVCGGDLGYYLLHEREEMPPETEKQYSFLVDRRCMRIPLQHITGVQSFMGLDFHVNEHVLVPRQDTEILGEVALKLLNDLFLESILSRRPEGTGPVAPDVLDLCTGSGCLAVAVKVFCPECKVTASDISEAALALARENAAANQADITFIGSNLFENIHESFDVIVSNPPYIPSAVIDGLMPEVRDHEPRMALDGGEDGLDFYRKIVDGCGEHLAPGGYLLLEIGDDEREAVSELMREAGFSDIRVIQDLSGRDRVVRGRSK